MSQERQAGNADALALSEGAPPHYVQWLHRLATWTVGIAGLAVLLFGWTLTWLLGAPLHPDLAGTKANTAIGLLALTAAIILLRPPRPTGVARLTGRALALFAATLGLATVAQDVFVVSLHIDTLLFADPTGRLTPGAPGRMSPITAAALALAGTAVFLLPAGGTVKVVLRESFSGLAFALPLFVIASHVYGSPVFETATQMAASTRIALVALGIGLFTVRPDAGRSGRFWGDTPGAYVERRLVPITIVGILVLGWLGTFLEDHGMAPAVATAFFAMSLIVATVLIIDASTRSLDRSESQRREAELAATKAREDLVAAVAEQRLFNAKLQFVNRAAHELNTPLTPVRVQVELLSSGRLGPLTAEQDRSVAQLSRNLDRLVHIVRQILDAADTRDRTPNLQTRTVALHDLVSAAAVQHRAVAANAGVHLTAKCEEEVYAEGDPERLELALSNLVLNAIDATPEGGEVWVTLQEVADEALVAVHDTGKGLSEEEVQRLFRPFTDLEESASTIPSDEGLGMGLYIARRIVAAHGGTIRCASTGPGEGAVFTIALPSLAMQRPPVADVDRPEAAGDVQRGVETRR